MGKFKKIGRTILLYLFKMGINCHVNDLNHDSKRDLAFEVVAHWEKMPLETGFNAAVKIIQNLPKEGPYQPSTDMKLKFYSYFKQATEGPCTVPRPPFYHVVNLLKWKAWKKLNNMPKEEAMKAYIADLKEIVGTMPYNADAETFIYETGLYREYEKLPTRKYKLSLPPGIVIKNEIIVDSETVDDSSENLPAKADISASSSSEDSSGGTDSFVICEPVTENFESEVLSGPIILNSSDSETEDEYSDPAESLDLPKYTSSPSGSAFFSLDSTQGVMSQLDNNALAGSVSQGEEFDKNSRMVQSKYDGQRPPNDRENSSTSGSRPVGLRRGDSIRGSSHKGLSADTSVQLIGVLQNIHQDLQAILIRLDSLEDKPIITQSRCSYCQREKSSGDISTQKKWWPFPELSPRSTFFLLLYPFFLPIAIKFFLMIRTARKLRASMNR